MGLFALFTAKLLVDFKLKHPEVHNMGESLSGSGRMNVTYECCTGDAGYIMFGPIGREIFSGGSVIFAVFAVVSCSSLNPPHVRT